MSAETATRELVGFEDTWDHVREPVALLCTLKVSMYRPESAGNGIGKLLMRELERARNCGCALLVLASSLNAVGFYESCGFYVKEQSSSSHCTQCTSGSVIPCLEDIELLL